MNDINKIYEIDENFKESRQKLVNEHEQELAKLSTGYMDKKKQLSEKLQKLDTSSKSIDTKDDASEIEKELQGSLSAKATSNKSKLQKFIEKNI